MGSISALKEPSQPKVEPKIRPALVSVHNSCTYLGCGKTKLYEMIQAGELEAVRLGSRTMVKLESLDALIARAEPVGKAA